MKVVLEGCIRRITVVRMSEIFLHHFGVHGLSAATASGGAVEESTDVRDSISEETPWSVIVLNDPVNLMSYVVSVFQKVFGYDDVRATKLMLEVHEIGRSVVWVGGLEKAETYARQLQRHLLLVRLEKA